MQSERLRGPTKNQGKGGEPAGGRNRERAGTHGPRRRRGPRRQQPHNYRAEAAGGPGAAADDPPPGGPPRRSAAPRAARVRNNGGPTAAGLGQAKRRPSGARPAPRRGAARTPAP